MRPSLGSSVDSSIFWISASMLAFRSFFFAM